MTEMNPEELFPPKPGGMVDTARKRAQAQQDQLDELNATEPEHGAYEAVRVDVEDADSGTERTITLSSSNPFAILLPRNPKRRGAVVLAIDNDVWISRNQGKVQDLAGTSGLGSAFYLPAGIAIPIRNKAQWWVSSTNSTGNSRVAVMADVDSP